jgi:aspartyl-tRNA(Asn)/glutamyl-tRNA(Gln) amidotransferase subunit C
MLAQLNDFFGIVEQMSAVDTSGVEPCTPRCRR